MSDRVSTYFSAHAVSWDMHYRGASPVFRLFDGVFRRGLKQRWDIMMKCALPAQQKTYLDVGCGTGAYSLVLAQHGAAAVTGVDIAPGMVELSRQRAAELGLQDRCRFLHGDFAQMEFPDRFDVVFAMGVFDYIRDYLSFWSKMVSLSSGLVIASFPARVMPRTPIRKLRYRWKGLPVYFYSQEQLEALGRAAGLKWFTVELYAAGLALIGSVQ